MRGTPKVALLIETARGYGRGLLRGIVRYARVHGPWSFYVTPGDFVQSLPRMQRWGGTGIIARIETPEIAAAIVKTGLPAIALDLSEEQLRSDSSLARLSEVSSDSRGAARMVAEHLVQRRFRHYAFVGVPDRIWSKRREESFCESVERAGFSVEVYRPPRRKADRVWDREQPILAAWLRRLPKPAGLMVCNDDRGREVLEACRTAGVWAPDELAVVGVDNDELLCEVADPPLSSVAFDAEQGGYRAAALLDQLMHRRVRRPQRLVVEPRYVVLRRSSDILALDDGDVVQAMRFIQDHAAEPIQSADVVRHVQVSRRALEIRFQKALGRTLHDAIQAAHLDQATRLLLETDLSIPHLAEASGYRTASYMIQVFRQQRGMTPARYRAKQRSTTLGSNGS